ncbi:hypothetical protein AUR64_10745 [Haloprofundus marisrubri]|uniref:DUF4013 domain-containing protein n=1 Tax=Haloprofundus marisrubri TaxID=1514971 RepID=A0A0W1RAG0_9EURY|nr:DUF4013 domain-containing protein [Haloprofundus marisrubri]KTG10069.1 hypothetical protein AUR64_10745 [Haloprofundus marisrubri]
MISDSLNYLRESDDAVSTVLVGGILLLLGFLILPLFTVAGYLVRVLRGTADGDERAPAFGDWVEMTVDGLFAAVVGFVYFVLPSLVVGLVGFLVLGTVFVVVPGEPSPTPTLSPLVGFVITLVTVVGSLAIWAAGLYVGPAAVTNYATTGRLGAAFAGRTLWQAVTTRTYATAWLSAVAILFASGILGGLLAATFVGGLLTTFVTFYALVAAAYLFGRSWRTIRTATPRNPVTGEYPAA